MKPVIAAIGIAALGSVFIAGMVSMPPENVTMAAYASPLKGRMTTQRLNAELALDKLDGTVIAPGQTFSFNDTVGTWSRNDGYRKAPVSFNGQLIWTWGGGVCQTSSTLYNALLLSGLELVERHRHRFAPGYVPAGRDAAVAYSNIDLKVRNPYAWPVTVRAEVRNGKLICSVIGKSKPTADISIVQEVVDVRRPEKMIDNRAGSGGKILNPGKTGFSVVTHRVWRTAEGERRELLSKDTYPAMNRVVRKAY